MIDKEERKDFKEPIFRETGDIGEINPTGFFYRYRKNRMIKRFGHRINLTKIEELIFQATDLTNRAIWIKGLSKLVIFIVIDNFTSSHKEKILDKLRVKLLNILPEASFPDHIHILKKLPLSNHGKIDDISLEKLYTIFKNEILLKSNKEEIFLGLCCEYLGVNYSMISKVEDRTFLELGGSSITILQLNNELNDILGTEYPEGFLKLIFEKPLKESLSFLRNHKQEKRKMSSIDFVDKKKCKLLDDCEILWKYDLKACVDSSPLVFQKK